MATKFLSILRKNGIYNQVIDANSVGRSITIRNAAKYGKEIVFEAKVKDTQNEGPIRAYLDEVNNWLTFNKSQLEAILEIGN